MNEPIRKRTGGWGLGAVALIIGTIGLFVMMGGANLCCGSVEKMKVGSVKGDIGAFNSALELYQKDVASRTYPNDFRQVLVDNCAGWQGPYMATISPDPWGNEYQYQSDGADYTIVSIHYNFPFQVFSSMTIRYTQSQGNVSVFP